MLLVLYRILVYTCIHLHSFYFPIGAQCYLPRSWYLKNNVLLSTKKQHARQARGLLHECSLTCIDFGSATRAGRNIQRAYLALEMLFQASFAIPLHSSYAPYDKQNGIVSTLIVILQKVTSRTKQLAVQLFIDVMHKQYCLHFVLNFNRPEQKSKELLAIACFHMAVKVWSSQYLLIDWNIVPRNIWMLSCQFSGANSAFSFCKWAYCQRYNYSLLTMWIRAGCLQRFAV